MPLSMYLDLESYADYIAAYKTFIIECAKVMVRELGTGVSDESVIAKADEVFEFERQIALVSMQEASSINFEGSKIQAMTPQSDRRNSTASYNPMLISEMKENYPNFNWDAYFKTVFSATNLTIGDDERVILRQPDYFEAIESMDASAEVKGRILFIKSNLFTIHNF